MWIITGTIKSTPTYWLPALSFIPSLHLRRKKALKREYERTNNYQSTRTPADSGQDIHHLERPVSLQKISLTLNKLGLRNGMRKPLCSSDVSFARTTSLAYLISPARRGLHSTGFEQPMGSAATHYTNGKKSLFSLQVRFSKTDYHPHH